MDPGDEEGEGENYSQDVFYTDHSNAMPGPSGISGTN